MKKLLLSLALLFILGLPQLLAQTIPNASFETWTDNSLAGWPVKDPNNGNGRSGWWDFNMLNSSLFGSSPVTVFQDSLNPSPEQGTYCAKIISDTMSISAYSALQPYGLPFSRTNGIIITAYIDVSFLGGYTFKTGIPFHGKMSSFSFHYRYIPNGSDSCSCSIALFHFNSVTKRRDLIGEGFWGDTAKVTTWTPATVNITYDSTNVTPDTVFIAFSACALTASSNPKVGDTMNIDNMSDVVTTDINAINAKQDKVNVYPNPANNSINLAITGQVQGSRVEVYDITGNLIGAYSIYNNFLTVNTQSYSSGLYFYKLLDNTGSQLNVGKFSVIR